MLTDTESYGEAQGGPPDDSSLQYRPGEIVLYLPKRCLLDKVAGSQAVSSGRQGHFRLEDEEFVEENGRYDLVTKNAA